jgi:hypothetical protein
MDEAVPTVEPAERRRRAYEPPELQKVPLRPEEAVLGSCKVASGSGPGATCGLGCSTVGS